MSASTAEGVPLQYVARIRYGLGEPPPLADDGAVPILRATNIARGCIVTRNLQRAHREDLPLDRAPLLEAGEVLVVRSGAYTGDSALVGDEWAGSAPGYDLRLTPFRTVEPRFLSWCLLSRYCLDQIEVVKLRVAQPHLNADDMASIRIPLPALEAQRRIADYLDAETARVDYLLELNGRKSGLLREHEAAVAVEFIGQAGVAMGEGTRTARLRWFDCDIQTGPFGSQLHAHDYVDHGWPLVNPSNIVDGTLVADDRARVSDDTRRRLSRHVLREGDVVFGRRGEMGRAAVVRQGQDGWVCGTGCLRVRFRTRRMLPEFLYEVLQSHGVRAWFDLMAVGSTMANLSEDLLGSLPLPVRSIEDQIRISAELADVRANHAQVEALMERQNRLLVERRQALITAAVTGELEV